MSVSHVTIVGTSTDLRVFGEFITEDSARSLDLLRKIEATVLAMETIRSTMTGFELVVCKFNESLSSRPDPVDEGALEAMEKAQDAIENLRKVMATKLAAAKKARELRKDDPVCPAYSQAIDVICELHDSIETLRWNIMQHNANLDTSDPGKTLRTPAEIKKFLATL
jgi:hypothetical protein